MSSDLDKLPIVLVQIGALPRHLTANLQYLVDTFPKRDVILLADQNSNSSKIPRRVKLIHIESFFDAWPSDFLVEDKRKRFRNNFWFTTKARLLILPVFMERFGVGRVLHLESDVWIHPDFPFEYFEKLDVSLAFPSADYERGVASIVLVNGTRGANLLIEACNLWSKNTDMEILGKILSTKKEVLELPSSFMRRETTFQHNMIFDGAALGMYLFGQDPRNTMGLINRFARSPLDLGHHKEGFKIVGNKLVLIGESKEKSVMSLHIHSKDVHIFSGDWLKVLRKQLSKEKRGHTLGFSPRALLFTIYELASRVLHKLFVK